MNRTVTLLALFALSIIHPTVVSSGRTPDTSSPTPTREILPGGLHLLVEERPESPIVGIEIRVRVGSGRESATTNGMAHFVEHMIFKGSTARPSGEVDKAMENLGGEIHAATTRETTQFSTVIPATHWKDAMGLLAEALQSPAFSQEGRDREEKVIRQEMALARTDPEKSAYTRLAAVAYDAADPAHLPLMGTEADIARHTCDALRAFHKANYRPENITVALVGRVKKEDARKFVAFLFQDSVTHLTETRPEITAYAALARPVHAAPDPDASRTTRSLVTVVAAFRAPAVRSDDTFPAWEILAHALGDATYGRLHSRIVGKEKTVQSLTCDFIPGRTMSLFIVTVVTTPKQAASFEKALTDELSRLREDTLTAKDAARAMRATVGAALYKAQTVEGRVKWLAMLDTTAPLMEPATWEEKARAVTEKDLNALVSRYLSPLTYAIVETGPMPPPQPETDTAGRAALPYFAGEGEVR